MPAAGHDKWGEAIGLYDAPKASSAPEADTAEATYKADEVINNMQASLNFLGMVAMPTVFLFLFPKILLAAWQLITQAALKVRDFTQIVLAIPRGHGKTTLLKLFILWCVLFTKKKFILVIAATEGKAENIIADVMDMLKENNILRLFGDYRFNIEKDTLELKKFSFRGRPITLAGIGAQTSLRGLNIKNERPDVMIFDDIQDDDGSESKVQSEALVRWMFGTAMKAKSPFGCLYLFVGNVLPGPYSIIKMLRNNPQWVKFTTGALLADGSALWPELHPAEQLLAEFANDLAAGRPDIFFSEVLNNPDAALKSKIDLSKIPQWSLPDTVAPQGKCIIIDPATGKGSKGDETTITLFYVYDGVPVVRTVISERQSPGDTIRAALVLALQENCKLIAVESTAYQSTLIYWFEFFCTQLQVTGIEFVEVANTQYSKNARITTILSVIERGELMLHASVRAVILNQIVHWNPMKRDNVDGILDTLTYIPVLVAQFAHLMTVEASLELADALMARVYSIEENAPY